MKPTLLKPWDVCLIDGKTVHFVDRDAQSRPPMSTFKTAHGEEFQLNDAQVTRKVTLRTLSN